MPNVKFEEMTDEQKQAAFQAWLGRRASSRVNSGAKRAAMAELRQLHAAEYNQLLEKHQKALGVKKAAK